MCCGLFARVWHRLIRAIVFCAVDCSLSISGVFLPAPLLINTARIEKVAGLVNFFAEFFYYENLYVRQELRAIMPTSKFKSRGGKHAANIENTGRRG